MKSCFLISVFSLLSWIASAQSTPKELLLNKSWKLQSDKMTGVGVHYSLHEETELQFLEDGSWKSTQPIKGVTQGTWRLENNDRTLTFIDSSGETKYLILKITDAELEYRLKKYGATYTLSWTSKK